MILYLKRYVISNPAESTVRNLLFLDAYSPVPHFSRFLREVGPLTFVPRGPGPDSKSGGDGVKALLNHSPPSKIAPRLPELNSNAKGE